MSGTPREIDNTQERPGERAPLITGGHNFRSLTDTVCRVWEAPRAPRAWYVAFAISLALLGVFGAMILLVILDGIGRWGLNIPTGWGFDITNFVFWVGIGHAGTLISAILFLFRQKWRTSINRFAEAMTIFAVMCAGIFPGIHVGRIWFAYWMTPYPNQMAMWPQFRSPLLWDIFAVSTYATVSLLFWYVGMIPDLATFRDRAKTRLKHAIYGLLALGWSGSSRHWHRFERAYLILAALATPLVLSVHSVVSFDFAVSIQPGWHTTIFPPYFVAGAIFGGFAMVLTLAIPARQLFGLRDIITLRHLENMCKILLLTGCIVGYAYGIEFFMAWYSGNPYESFIFKTRAMGPYSWAYWTMISCNVLAPQLLWFRRMRTRPWLIFLVVMCVNVGMWFERFVIIVTSLSQDFLPSSWHYYKPTWVEILTLAGSFGLFMTLFLLFCRYLPMVAMAEVKTVMPHADPHAHPHQHVPATRRFDYNPDEYEPAAAAAMKPRSDAAT
jgi:Ni/Fe-hydrogenase subunit HybB-like protein